MLFTRMTPFKFRIRPVAWLLNAVCVGKYYREEKHPVSRVLFWLYEKPCRLVLRWPKTVIALAVLVVLSTVPVYIGFGNVGQWCNKKLAPVYGLAERVALGRRLVHTSTALLNYSGLGHEFMPPLNEGTILYMPTTLPRISITEASRLMQIQDRTLKSFPEVLSVHGKAGRADTATDPAPFSMMETVVQLKPKSQWRPGLTWEKLIAEMDAALQIPGNVNAWTMPIKGRIDMLTTGVRTPVGIKVLGANLDEIQRIGEKLETALRNVPGTRSIFAERAAGGFFVDIIPKREALARYGLTIDEVHGVLMSAIGGETVATTIEGRERYSINLRYPRDLRAELDQLERVLVKTMMGRQIPLVELAEIKLTTGPAMIRDENGMLAGYVYVDITGRDVGGYVEDAKKAVAGVALPTGYHLVWSGQYENMIRVRDRLKIVLPVTIALIFLLLYMNTKSAFKTLVVMLAVPFSLVGAVWLLYALGYNVSIAVWVGMIALMGLDAETGVFMLLFLDLSYDEAQRAGKLRNEGELEEAIIHGAVKRIRPKLMTVAAAMMGLMPIMWSVGAGADMMKRIAAPMVGGLATSFVMELLVYPAIYLLWKRRALDKLQTQTER